MKDPKLDLTKVERVSLLLTSEALVHIRRIAARPITPEGQKAIVALADALHNVPLHVATCGEQRASMENLLEAAIEHASGAYRDNGLQSLHVEV